MELILWRHAEARDGTPDLTRALTPKGLRQAAKIGQWLDRNLPDNCRILASPAVRSVQTAEALERKFKTDAALAPDASVRQILAAARWPDSREPVLIIGHQPALGRVAALLIGGSEQNWTIRKSAVCWIAQKAAGETASIYLRAMLGPDLAGK